MADTLDSSRQLQEALRHRCAEGNPELYRQLALYLQVLRDGLLQAVQQACFHLATEVHGDRYRAMSPARRCRLHRRLMALVARANALLTVEQLSHLACQLHRERLNLLARPLRPSEPEPPGSIRLALEPPIQLGEGWSPPSSFDPNEAGEASGEGLLQLLQSVVVGMDPELPDGDGPFPPWATGRLPEEPGLLLVWLEGLEQALDRRLRNLSHAINVELGRLGLITSLLPLPLLEAVLQGRVEQHPSVPNLVRLPGPAGEVLVLLLRRADLELGQPALRTCRGRCRAHLAEVRKMADQSRRLQRRIQVLEAQELWLSDINSPSP